MPLGWLYFGVDPYNLFVTWQQFVRGWPWGPPSSSVKAKHPLFFLSRKWKKNVSDAQELKSWKQQTQPSIPGLIPFISISVWKSATHHSAQFSHDRYVCPALCTQVVTGISSQKKNFLQSPGQIFLGHTALYLPCVSSTTYDFGFLTIFKTKKSAYLKADVVLGCVSFCKFIDLDN